MLARLRPLFRLAALAAATAPILAQGSVKLTATFQPAAAKPGDAIELHLAVEVNPGYHAYGTKEQTNVPVRFDAEQWTLAGLELAGDPRIPTGDKKTVFGVETWPLPEHFTIVQPMKVPAGLGAGEIEVMGVFAYQLCDENACEMPTEKEFAAKLAIAGGPAGNATSGSATAGNANAATQEPKPATQDPKPSVPKPKVVVSKDGHLVLKPRIGGQPLRAGESAELVIEISVEEGYHVYGSKETTGVPVGLDPKKQAFAPLVADGTAVVPPGEEKEELGLKQHPLPSEFRVTQTLRVPAGTAPGTYPLKGVLDYAACNENGCEDPTKVEFAVEVVVEAGEARAKAPRIEPATNAPEGDEDNSLWGLILACIGGGLLALVMPCTYPMIPITFSFFTKQADARGGKVLSLALAYGFGIVGMFAAIGALASVLGGYIVPFAAHWITNTVIGTAFVVFGLSLLGVINLQPPQFLMSAAGRTRSVGGLVGVLLMGATLVISSFTCTAPVVAILLVPAVQSGEGFRPMLGMAAFGATMALPFVLLALLPGRVKKLPRSGEWMNTLKVSLGFVELAAALKFFSNAEYVQELHVLPRETFFGIWIALFLALAAFLWGLFPRAQVGTGRRVGGLASVAFAGYCLYGALGYPLDFVMTALAPAYGARDVSRHELVVDDYEKARALAVEQGKLLLVNWTGFTCTNCRMVERSILPDEAIAPILEQHFVEARLHMDNESAIPADRWKVHVQLRQDMLQGRVTTPTYCSVDPKTGTLFVEHVLKGGPGAWQKGYLQFLQTSLAKAGRVAAK